MIKILFCIEDIHSGGAEKVLRNLVNNMDQKKFDITVQTVWPCDPEAYLAPGIRYSSMYPSRSRKNVLLCRLEAALGLTYRRHIRRDYDIEIAYLECGATKIMAGSTNKKAVKLAWVHCDLQKAMADPAGFARKTARHYGKFDKVICVSKQGKESFDQLFDNRFETRIVYNTVDCREILEKADAALSERPQRPLVVSAGRLAAPKRYIRLLKAHKRLMQEGIVHDLVILGEGPERGELEQYIAGNGLQDSVRLPGFCANPYPYMKNADLLVCSSVYECFSTFISEGLILGKPIVTTDVSGMRELLGDSRYGLVTDNDDDAFYEGMKRMLLDDDLRAEYARKAAVRGKDFSTEKLVRETERFFEDCVNGRG